MYVCMLFTIYTICMTRYEKLRREASRSFFVAYKNCWKISTLKIGDNVSLPNKRCLTLYIIRKYYSERKFIYFKNLLNFCRNYSTQENRFNYEIR